MNFKGLAVAKNFFRPEGVPLKEHIILTENMTLQPPNLHSHTSPKRNISDSLSLRVKKIDMKCYKN